jgi:hypothetical protein
MMVRYLNLKEEVGGSVPGCEISSLSDGKLAKWSTAFCQPSIPKLLLLLLLLLLLFIEYTSYFISAVDVRYNERGRADR